MIHTTPIDVKQIPASPSAVDSSGLRTTLYTLRKAGIVGVISLLLLTAFVGIALFGPLVAPYPSDAIDLSATLQPPSAEHIVGTDALGRDIYSRLLYGARVSLSVSVMVVLIGGLSGAAIGYFSGFMQGRTDAILMRVIDTLMAFPGILLALMIVAVLGPGLYTAMIAVGISQIPMIARISRASILVAGNEQFATAAYSIGASRTRILFRHLIPNSLTAVVVQIALIAGDAILIASGLSFIGLGAQPPTPEWGAMLSESRLYLWQAPWLAIAPGLAILLAVLAFNLLGDALRRILDTGGGV